MCKCLVEFCDITCNMNWFAVKKIKGDINIYFFIFFFSLLIIPFVSFPSFPFFITYKDLNLRSDYYCWIYTQNNKYHHFAKKKSIYLSLSFETFNELKNEINNLKANNNNISKTYATSINIWMRRLKFVIEAPFTSVSARTSNGERFHEKLYLMGK
jgi:hypothetical protein